MTTKPLTKTQLVAAVAEASGVDKKTANLVLDALSDTIKSEVANGGGVTIPGIVKITAKHRPARTVRNPSTGETIHKDADQRVSAVALRTIKDALANT
jgi:DNA-binding protein HU-beta